MKTRLKPKVVVIGAGVSGMVTSLVLADLGTEVFLISKDPLGQINSVQHSSINAALGLCEDNHSENLAKLTLASGESLSQQDLVNDMAARSTEVIGLMERLGVVFDRTPEGHLKGRAPLGSDLQLQYGSTDAPLGRQLAVLLADQIRQRKKDGTLFLFERWVFLSLVLDDDGVCCGVLAQNLATQEILVFKADAVILATGGYSSVFGKQALARDSQDGFAQMRAYEQGATFANAEFVATYPYAWAGFDFSLAVPDFLLADSRADFWVKRGGENFSVLKQWYGSDVAHCSAVEMHRLFAELHQHGDFRDGPVAAYLDITRLAENSLYQSTSRSFSKLAGLDVRQEPIPVQPNVCQTMGGLVIDANHQTTIKSLYAVGDAACGYHGAASVSGNSLLVSFSSGLKVARFLAKLLKENAGSYLNVADDVYQNRLNQEKRVLAELLDQSGPENCHDLKETLATHMFQSLVTHCHGDGLQQTLQTVEQLKDRLTRVHLADRGGFFNRELLALRGMKAQLNLAQIMLMGALKRTETRGFHVRTDFQMPDDAQFAQPTLARKHGDENEVYFKNDSNVVKLNVG